MRVLCVGIHKTDRFLSHRSEWDVCYHLESILKLSVGIGRTVIITFDYLCDMILR